MKRYRFQPKLILIISIFAFLTCSKHTNYISAQVTKNSKATLNKPYLILISLDGFRWDYVDRFDPPHISSFIKNGTKAESLIPSFPTKTFPNHYTIATGMYPDKHEILGNSFYSFEKNKIYKLGDRNAVEDGTWYGGTPIWVQANKAKMVTASYFFVGSEADVQGVRPTFYYRFDGSVKNEIRVAQALDWLALPEKERPHLITMYFSDLDNVGHRVGPNNDGPLKKAVLDLDQVLGRLFEGVKATGLPVNIILVSDHGMLEVPVEKYLPEEMVKNDDLYLAVSNGSIINIYPRNEKPIDTIYQYLKTKEDRFKVYKTENAPHFEYTPKNKNWGALQVIPDEGYYFIPQRGIGFKKSLDNKIFGHHGFDPKLKEMHGIFYGNGPAFKKGHTVPSVKNIHIYPVMCQILDLKIPKDIDGKLDQLKDVLKEQ